MADRFKFMAMNAPIDVLPLEMGFGFRQDLTIDEFLNKINLPHLFHNVAYWQSAQFKFVVHGQDQEGCYLDKELNLVVEAHEHTLAELAGVVRQAYFDIYRYFYDAPPTISKMYITMYW